MSIETVRIDFSTLAAYNRCPAYFSQRYMQGKVLPSLGEPVHLTFGTNAHKVLELYHGGLTMAESLNEVSQRYDNKEDRERYSFWHLERLLQAYARHWDDSDYKIVSTERRLEAEIFNDGNYRIIYQGTADAIMDEHGEHVLWEHKTASNLGASFGVMAEMSNQACGYALLCRMNGLANVTKVRYNGLNTYPSPLQTHLDLTSRDYATLTQRQQKLLVDNVPFRRALVERNDSDIERYVRDIIITVNQIRENIKAGYFMQKRHEPCFAYNKPCEFIQVCNNPKLDYSTDYEVSYWKGWKHGQED